MGNTVLKGESDLLEDADDCSSANCEFADFQSHESARLSDASGFSEFSFPLEDAVSLNTDSTTSATEYESAHDNDVSSNRLSSCTDVSYDIPLDSKASLKEASDHHQQFASSTIRKDRLLDVEDVNQVSYSSCVSSVDQLCIFDDAHEFGRNETPPIADADVEATRSIPGPGNDKNHGLSAVDGIVTIAGRGDFDIARGEVDEDRSNSLSVPNAVNECEEQVLSKGQVVSREIAERTDPDATSLRTTDAGDECQNLSKTSEEETPPCIKRKLCRPSDSIRISNNFGFDRSVTIPNAGILPSNLVVQQRSQSVRDLVRETSLLKMNCERNKSADRRRQVMCGKKSKSSSTSRCEKNAAASKTKTDFRKLPVVYKDFLILNYEDIFKEKSKSNYSEFDNIGNVLSEALNKVTVMLETSTAKEVAAPNAQEIEPSISLKMFDRNLADALSAWALYPAFFEFGFQNVWISYDHRSFRLDEAVVERFFANRWLYTSLLDGIEFCIECYAERLRYVAGVSKKQLSDLLGEHRTPTRRRQKVIKGSARSELENTRVESDTKTASSRDTGDQQEPGVLDRLENMETTEQRSTEARCGSTGIEEVKIQMSVNLHHPSGTETSCNSSMIEGSVLADQQLSEGWSDLCSLNSGSSYGFPSLRSEIMDCVFQFDSIDSNIMNCSENISEAGPATAADIDNINNIPLLNDSSDLDFISKVGGTGLVAENLRKQSLYVKFDPLVADETSGTLNGDVTLKLSDSTIINDSIRDTSIDLKSDGKDHSSEVTDSKVNENGAIGKLISVTPNKSPRKVTPKSSPRFPETDADDVAKLQSLLLKQMKKEEAFKEEIELLKRDHEQAMMKVQNAEKEISQLRSALESVQENEKKLKNELKERIKNKQQLSIVMEEYEKTISQMVTRREEEKKEFEATMKKIEAERDSTVQHLNNLENAFNDIHQKYERGKAVNEALKKNEDLLKKSLSEYEVTVKTVENKYELLKSHATSQLDKANQELELITQSYEKEQAKLKAMLRKSEIQINSLQNALDRKTKENQELTAICDELIVKLSTHSNA